MSQTYSSHEDADSASTAFTSYLVEKEQKVSFNVLLQEGEHELVPTYLSKLLDQLTELSEERFIEAFLESGPQVV